MEAYWENGHSKQRVIANLGRKDLLAPHLESLIELLGGGQRTKGSSAAERIEATFAACWGPMLVARWLWRELGLENILDGLASKTNRVQKAGRHRSAFAEPRQKAGGEVVQDSAVFSASSAWIYGRGYSDGPGD